MPASLINDPEHWRKRTDETRNLADDMKDEISKQMMLQIAADYGHLARRARARRWRSRFPAPHRSCCAVRHLGSTLMVQHNRSIMGGLEKVCR